MIELLFGADKTSAIFWLLVQWYYFLNGLLSGALLGIYIYRNHTRKWDWRRKW